MRVAVHKEIQTHGKTRAHLKGEYQVQNLAFKPNVGSCSSPQSLAVPLQTVPLRYTETVFLSSTQANPKP